MEFKDELENMEEDIKEEELDDDEDYGDDDEIPDPNLCTYYLKPKSSKFGYFRSIFSDLCT